MLNFFAAINHLGYGVFSYNLIRAYDEHVSRDIALFPIPVSPEFTNDAINRWIANGANFKRADPGIMIFQAPWLNRFAGNPTIGLPIFELDVVPEYDLRILQELDFVLQPSEWGKRVLENHGLTNVHVVPGGYDLKHYHPDLTIDQKMERLRKHGVSFVHVGKFEPRKSSEEILRCFLRACKNGDVKTNLLFHVSNPFDPDWFVRPAKVLTDHGCAQSGSHFVKGNCRILVPKERFSGELKKLYQMAEFGIWASKAEGWNLPLIECLACGRPCLTTDNTAQKDFIRTGVYPQELILATHQKEPTRAGGQWWPIDQEELTEKIRAIILEPEKFLRMEEACLKSIRDFTWGNSAKKLDEMMRAVLHK